jgi:Flp pilus assembly protein TadG
MTMAMPLHRSPPRAAQAGAAVLEFAVLMAVLVTFMLLVAEYGRLMMQYQTLVKSARAAARYASTQPPGTNTLQAQCLAVTGSLAVSGTACATTTPLLTGLGTSNVALSTGTLDATTATVKVRVSGLVYVPAFTTLGLSITFEPIDAVMPQPK